MCKPVHCFVLFVLISGIAVGTAGAASPAHERQGAVLGFNVGLGWASVDWKQRGATYESGGEVGGAGALRAGYAFNSQFALTFEGRAWSRDYDEGDITLSTALIVFTWYPGGHGFFLRTGLGGGRGKVTVDVFDPALVWEESGPAFGLGLGHEWRLTRTFALGTALDFNALSIDDFGELTDVTAGFTSLTVQLNWYL